MEGSLYGYSFPLYVILNKIAINSCENRKKYFIEKRNFQLIFFVISLNGFMCRRMTPYILWIKIREDIIDVYEKKISEKSSLESIYLNWAYMNWTMRVDFYWNNNR